MRQKTTFTKWCSSVFTLLLLVWSFSASAMAEPPRFTRYTASQGLSHNMIFDMVRDKRGFLWIATFNGLSRFDGYEFKTYRVDTDDPHSLPSNMVRNVYIDSKNRLWVGTQSGLARYDEDIDGFHVYTGIDSTEVAGKDKIWSYTLLPNGKLLISTSFNSYIYDEQSDSFTPRSITSSNRVITEIRESFYDKDAGWYWLGSFYKGIFLWDGESHTAIDVSKENTITEKIDAESLFDVEKINDELWLATSNGLYILDKNYRIKSHKTEDDGLSTNSLRAIAKISDSTVWIASELGLNITDINAESFTTVYESTQTTNGLGNNYIYEIYKDANDIVWLGGVSGGLHQYNPGGSFFSKYEAENTNKIWAISRGDSPENVWVATQSGGIQNFSSQAEKFTTYLETDGSPVWSLYSYYDQKVWYSTDNKIGWLDPKTKIFEFVDTKTENHNVNFTVLDDALWYSTSGNQLTKLTKSSSSPSGYKLTRYELPKRMPRIKHLSPYYSTQLLLGTDEDLYLFNPEERSLSVSLGFDFNGKQTFISSVEFNGSLFVATAQSGVFKSNLVATGGRPDRTVSHFFEDEDILNMSLVDDQLWLVTVNGVYDITNPNEPKSLVVFDSNIQEDLTSAFITSDKSIYLGSLSSGLIKIKLNHKGYSDWNEPVQLTSIWHYNKSVSPLKFSESNSSNILNSQNIAINADSNQFTLKFSLPSAPEPQKVRYRYQLAPLDSDWTVVTATNREATYTDLDSGDYRFIVQASTALGDNWGNERTLDIQILPHWWLSKFALASYIAFGLIAISFLLWVYRNKQRQAQLIAISEERLKLSLWGSGDQLWDWNILSGELFRHNDWDKLRDFPVDGKRWGNSHHSNIHPQDLLSMQNELQGHLDGDTEHFEATYRVKVPNGWLWILDRGKVVTYDNNGNPLRMAGTLKDISALVAAEERVKMLATSVTNISDGICIYDTQFLLKEVNPAFEKITGYKRDEILDKPFELPLYHQGFVEQIKHELGIDGSWHGEIADRRADGTTYQMELTIDTVRDDAGDIVFYVCSFSDISERKRNETELRRLANTDTLTGLPNRSYFQMSHSNLVRKRLQHALLVFDLDNFKKVNDSLGHETGDRLLCQVVERLQNIGRKQDTLYRLGGDEFGFLIEDSTDLNLITKVATDINELVATPFHINEQEVVISSSIGIVAYPNDGNTSQELLQSADNAMYHAKRRGGNCYQFFSESMNQNAVSRLQLENTIRQALKNDWLQVHFQPKVDIASQTVAGVEALARIQVPDEGMLSPLTFIPLAEETGLIIELGEHVLRQSCRAMRQWLAAGLPPCRMAVNLSARQFNQATLVDDIERILKEERIEAKYIEFEITEGMVMQDPERAIHIMTELTEMGIHLALDDFGTGYSSLAYLKRFPIHSLKIDKAFVDDIAVSDVDRNMVASIISMAHNMGLNVVAEGVETTEQMTVLRTLRCEYAQGYLFAKPLALNHWLNFGQEQTSKI